MSEFVINLLPKKDYAELEAERDALKARLEMLEKVVDAMRRYSDAKQGMALAWVLMIEEERRSGEKEEG